MIFDPPERPRPKLIPTSFGKCQFPLWKHNERPTQRFCGAAVVEIGSSWCRVHEQVVFAHAPSRDGRETTRWAS